MGIFASGIIYLQHSQKVKVKAEHSILGYNVFIESKLRKVGNLFITYALFSEAYDPLEWFENV